VNTPTPEQRLARIADCLDTAAGNLDGARWYYGEAPISEVSNGLNAVIGAVNDLRLAIKQIVHLLPDAAGAAGRGGDGEQGEAA
jgi:hypothetical protein